MVRVVLSPLLIRQITAEYWNENARKIFNENGVEEKIIDKHPFQKVREY